MNFARILLITVIVAGGLALPLRTIHAQPSSELRQAELDFVTLEKQLEVLNQEIASLKRMDRSLRNEYRLRDQLAEAEALAQKVTHKKAQINRLKGHVPAEKNETIIAITPKATANDNPFELEAKADLLADQSVRLNDEADRLQKASVESRKRQAMRRQAGKWDRDPFASFETSKRQLPTQPAKTTVVSTTADRTATQGTIPVKESSESSVPKVTNPTVGSMGNFSTPETPKVTPTSPPAMVTAPDQGNKQPVFGATTPLGFDSSSGTARITPVPVTIGGIDRGGGEYRIFLDPSTAALIRHALRSEGSPYDPESLLRAAEVLRNRAKDLSEEAKALRARSQQSP